MTVARLVIDVVGAEDETIGWLIGSDADCSWLPSAGDLVTLPAGAMRELVLPVIGSTTLPVVLRHLDLEGRSRSAPTTRLFLGAQSRVDLEVLRRLDGWLDYSPRSEDCARQGCYKDLRRDADSALYTCARGGHDICLDCDRPVAAPVRFCPYHSSDSL